MQVGTSSFRFPPRRPRSRGSSTVLELESGTRPGRSTPSSPPSPSQDVGGRRAAYGKLSVCSRRREGSAGVDSRVGRHARVVRCGGAANEGMPRVHVSWGRSHGATAPPSRLGRKQALVQRAASRCTAPCSPPMPGRRYWSSGGVSMAHSSSLPVATSMFGA
jgi:hypothetical protein